MSQKENKKKYLEEYRVTLRIFESVFYKSLIRACSFDNFLAASQNARSYGQTINHRALRICKKRIQKVLMLSPCILINIFSYLLSDSYMQHYLQITICNKFRKMLRLIKKHTQGEIQKWKKDGTFTIRINN